jgi:Pentapeptide repeats (8 copies)
MANPDHLEILKQGVEVWNAWRAKPGSPVPDLSGADLRLADLREAHLFLTNLSGANLSGANSRTQTLMELS